MLNFQITLTLLFFTAVFLHVALPIRMVLLDRVSITNLDGSLPFILLSVCAPLPVVLIYLFYTYQGVVNAMRVVADQPIHYRSAPHSSNNWPCRRGNIPPPSQPVNIS